MESTLEELRWKEVIGANNGVRYGYVNDLMIDLDTGRVKALVVPGQGKWLGLLGGREPRLIPWENISHIGADIILTQAPPSGALRRSGGGKRRENEE
jgi:YlmC/YmxH family sporulation protein